MFIVLFDKKLSTLGLVKLFLKLTFKTLAILSQQSLLIGFCLDKLYPSKFVADLLFYSPVMGHFKREDFICVRNKAIGCVIIFVLSGIMHVEQGRHYIVKANQGVSSTISVGSKKLRKFHIDGISLANSQAVFGLKKQLTN
jgi:hypothetical protein